MSMDRLETTGMMVDSFIDVSNASEMPYANEAVTLMFRRHSSANVLAGYARHHYSEVGFGEQVIVAVGR